ncbi:MAG: glycosyltransferase family 2 protein, partial [Thermoprotei archaeon]
MKLSIIIPVFNEEKTVEKLIEEVWKVELPQVEKEIIVVDDGSTDATPEILKRVKNRYPELKVVFKKKNEGKGSAIRRGLKEV